MPLPPLFVPTAAQQDAAVELLVQSFPAAERKEQQERFVQWLALPPSHGFALRCLGENPDQPLAAVLFQVLPGKVALLWSPALRSHVSQADGDSIVATLLSSLHAELAQQQMELVQLLLPAEESSPLPDAQLLDRIMRAGYSRLARLLYLYLSDQQHPFPAAKPISRLFNLQPASTLSSTQLESLIERTYSGTQDCPLMSGLRTPAQVLAGYKAAGSCGQDYWFIPVGPDGEPQGVLLLAPDPEQKTCELVYIGIVPEARYRGVANELLTWAKWYAREAGCNQILLAVDDQNLPGLKLYSRHGFQSFDARLVYVHPLPSETR